MSSPDDFSDIQTQALVLLYTSGGVAVSQVPETSANSPGRRIFQALIKKGLVYQAQGWTQKNGTSHSTSYELTYEGALAAKYVVAETDEEKQKLQNQIEVLNR